jgi:acetyl-CoA carboxylase biotin carboxyl carrier protein
MDLQKIKSLIDFAASSDLEELELEENGCRLRLSRRRQARASSGAVPAEIAKDVESRQDLPTDLKESTDALRPEPVAHIVRASMFGLFSRSPAPQDAPFVQIGDLIQKGQKLALLEAMKIFHAVESDRDGKIIDIFVEDGQEVDAGQALFKIE